MALTTKTSSTDSLTAGLNLGTGAINFAKAIADNVVRGNTMFDAGREIVKWLSRELIEEREFEYCISRVTGLAHPNDGGQKIRQSLSRSNFKVKKLAGLNLVMAGSVGRMMAFDPDLAYLVSTVAATLAYHDMKWATDAICYMTTDTKERLRSLPYEKGIHHPYDTGRARIKPVVEKIVSSIALNVVNSGYDFRQDMPRELAKCCIHTSQSGVFAAVVMAVVHETERDLMLYSSKLFGDIFLWLLVHYTGSIQVSIAGKIMYEAMLGTAPTRLRIFVRDSCDPENNVHGSSELQMSASMGEGFIPILKTGQGTTSSGLTGAQPSIRQALYDIATLNRVYSHSTLTPSELNDVGATAQVIVKWLLNLQLRPFSERGFGFDAELEMEGDGPISEGSITVETILKNHPTISQQKYGSGCKVMSVFKGLPLEEKLDDDSSWDDRTLLIHEIVECFPVAKTLLDNISSRCYCSNCKSKKSIGARKFGCLAEKALALLLTLLAHAIAEGLGAHDVSGLVDSAVLQSSMQSLFSELIVRNWVLWDSWFAVASVVSLGCPLDISKLEVIEGVTSLVAVQFGSFATVASWVDLSSKLQVSGCFGFEISEGRLCGVIGDFALVQAEQSMAAPIDPSTLENGQVYEINHDQEDEPNELRNALDPASADASKIQVETAIIGAAGIPYRLLVLVQGAGSVLRIVDPSDAIMAFCRSAVPQCKHDALAIHSADINFDMIEVWDIEGAVGCWNRENGRRQDLKTVVRMTEWCDSHLKLNVALSLSPHGCVIRGSHCCLKCAMAHVPEKIKTISAQRILSKLIKSRVLVRTGVQ
jgi:hypothetical protein